VHYALRAFDAAGGVLDAQVRQLLDGRAMK
jgi:hypothetical protein